MFCFSFFYFCPTYCMNFTTWYGDFAKHLKYISQTPPSFGVVFFLQCQGHLRYHTTPAFVFIFMFIYDWISLSLVSSTIDATDGRPRQSLGGVNESCWTQVAWKGLFHNILNPKTNPGSSSLSPFHPIFNLFGEHRHPLRLHANFIWTRQVQCCPLPPAWVLRPPKAAQSAQCLCLFIRASFRSLRDLQTAELWEAWRREGRWGGVKMPAVGIGSSSPAWTAEPQCGVPVHILKLSRPSAPCKNLFVPLLTPSFSSYFCQVFSFYLFFCLSHGSYITWLEFFSSMQQQADESGWAGSLLQPSCFRSPLSLCSRSQHTASPRGEANERRGKKNCPPSTLSFLPLLQSKKTKPSCQKGGNVKSNIIQCEISHRAFSGIGWFYWVKLRVCSRTECVSVAIQKPENIAQWIIAFSSKSVIVCVYVCVCAAAQPDSASRQVSLLTADEMVFTDTGSIS